MTTSTHQSHEDTDELYDVSVGHGVESSKQGVEDGDTGWGDDGHFVGETYDHPQGAAYRNNTVCHGADLVYFLQDWGGQSKRKTFLQEVKMINSLKKEN